MFRTNRGLYVGVNRDIRRRAYNILLAEQDSGGSLQRFGSLVMQPLDKDTLDVPGFNLTYEEAQALFDELWGEGLRSSKEVSGAGEKEALLAHIQTLKSEVDHLRAMQRHHLGIV